ncbi:hypothetical protein DACRYDRAFT_105842 [Dacryopinax primogenitus]|uniref:DNA2/NAM7 helicase-like C-terminal domain-containing protein n=1 Tax=Dacryopinax primogenitus (strain DJM 731) TaxID=1858805 RepID=M5GC64_DACPD|nr:uncharacterized protein DACRYDRAFT_105842 [Dacryopinax primogenitus]EJU03682.1 hypothetical protein DACRYDRAFT_105842 [Dacryopinax primogenitus]
MSSRSYRTYGGAGGSPSGYRSPDGPRHVPARQEGPSSYSAFGTKRARGRASPTWSDQPDKISRGSNAAADRGRGRGSSGSQSSQWRRQDDPQWSNASWDSASPMRSWDGSASPAQSNDWSWSNSSPAHLNDWSSGNDSPMQTDDWGRGNAVDSQPNSWPEDPNQSPAPTNNGSGSGEASGLAALSTEDWSKWAPPSTITSWADDDPASESGALPPLPVDAEWGNLPKWKDRLIFTDTAASVVDEDEFPSLLPSTSQEAPPRSPQPAIDRSSSGTPSTVRSGSSLSRHIEQPRSTPIPSMVRSRATSAFGKGKNTYMSNNSTIPVSTNNDWDVVDHRGDEADQNYRVVQEAIRFVNGDWDPLPDGPGWNEAGEPINNVNVEDEIVRVWEDGARRDVESEDGGSGRTTPGSTDTLINPSDLPEGVPRIRPFIGLSAAFTPKARISAVVLATQDSIVIINMSDAYMTEAADMDKEVRLRELLITLLEREKPTNIATDFGRLALAIHRDLDIHVNGIDLSASLSGTTRTVYMPAQLALMTTNHPHKSVLKELALVLKDQGNEEGPSPMTAAVAGALFAALFADGRAFEPDKIVRLKTQHVQEKELCLLETMQLQADVVDRSRPSTYEADVVSCHITATNAIVVTNARYATNIRPRMNVMITFDNGQTLPGRAVATRSKQTMIEFTNPDALLEKAVVESILVVGGDLPTMAEVAKRDWMLSQLREPSRLSDRSDIFRSIWFPTEGDIKMLEDSVRGAADLADDDDDWRVPLDESQTQVAAVMCCPEYPVVLTHGPPGSGKTRTISAAVYRWTELGQTSWLNGFSQFKLLVSADFYTAWHESVYTDVSSNLITLDDLPDKMEDLWHALRNYPVILCTLSMMSSRTLITRGLFEVIPVQNLVIDEASQIFTGDFPHLFYRISTDLKKLQSPHDYYLYTPVPPFGSDLSEELSTVFDLPHLQKNMHFLRTTYRVPFALNQFLSDEVYKGNLHSRFKPDRSTSVLKFINVSDGEEIKVGTSWRNLKEAQAVVHLVEKYYHHKNFVVLTPYDAQRACIEQLLLKCNRAWRGKVYNVDSFQGNEADYVLLSLVRTSRPGFLTSTQRSNVMLSRCKLGMVIVTKSSFLHRRAASDTLVGRLATRWERDHPTSPWVNVRYILNGNADMPGVKGNGPKRPERGWQGDNPYAMPNPASGFGHVTFGSLYSDIIVS